MVTTVNQHPTRSKCGRSNYGFGAKRAVAPAWLRRPAQTRPIALSNSIRGRRGECNEHGKPTLGRPAPPQAAQPLRADQPCAEGGGARRIDGQSSSTERDPIRPAQRHGRSYPRMRISGAHHLLSVNTKGCVMEVSELRQRRMVNARRLIARLSTFKIVFTLSSSGYCAIHWLVSHNFSTYVFSSALVFGAMAAMAIAWLANFALGGQARRGS